MEKEISKGKHQKHAKLARPQSGFYARNEIGLFGTSCSKLKPLANKIAELIGGWNISYLDEKHQKDISQEPKNHLSYTLTKEGSGISSVKLDVWNPYQIKKRLSDTDLLLVNNNHFETEKQVLVLDPEKDLSKKLDKTYDIQAVYALDDKGESDIKKEYERLMLLRGKSYEIEVPFFSYGQEKELADFLSDIPKQNISNIKGLVLSGGKSVRMGKDKSKIDYHGKPQKDYVYDLLTEQLDEVYFSCREDQLSEFEGRDVITDKFYGLGPFGAILSAFQHDPDSAWLVVAIDLPLIDPASIKNLLSSRNASKAATCFINPETEWHEPLMAIYEPKIYQSALSFLGMGYSCPRKVLINNDVEKLQVTDASFLTNVNTPEDLEKISLKTS